MLEEKVLETIRKHELIENGDTIVIGVSGGPDSMTLLNVLILLNKMQKINCKLVVAHINHGIRVEADEETKYVQEFCQKNNIPCYVRKEKVEELARESKIGTEEAGRKARYEFFDEISQKTSSNKIAVAHNKNDKIETIIMHVLRGSGTSGLIGIEPIRENKYIRPLIETAREDIEKYCLENNLEPKIDKTNLESIYKRNKIRNDLIPYIKKEFNPNIVKTINRLSEVATEENEYLEKIAKSEFENISVNLENNLQEKQVALDLKKFNNLELVIKRRVILYTISKVTGSTVGIEKVNIDEIIKLCKNNIGNKYLTPTKNIKILVKNRKVFFISLT